MYEENAGTFEQFLLKLAYFRDVFCKLNELNLQHQSKDVHIYMHLTDYITALSGKLEACGNLINKTILEDLSEGAETIASGTTSVNPFIHLFPEKKVFQ